MIVTVDTGGTKTLITGFDSQGQPGREYKFPTPKNQKEYLTALLAALSEHYQPAGIDAIVVGVPGVITDDSTVAWCGNLPWKNFALADELKKHYTCPIWLQNDAKLAGLSETNALKTVPAVSMYATISTGIGVGVIMNGKLLPELARTEAGHMLLEFDGKLHKWEDFASGKAIHEVYGKYAYQIDDPRIWERIADAISRGFMALIPAFQPDVIIIGGSIGTHFDHYDNILRNLLDDKLAKGLIRPKLLKATHPQEAVIYGCYYYAVQKLAA